MIPKSRLHCCKRLFLLWNILTGEYFSPDGPLSSTDRYYIQKAKEMAESTFEHRQIVNKKSVYRDEICNDIGDKIAYIFACTMHNMILKDLSNCRT